VQAQSATTTAGGGGGAGGSDSGGGASGGGNIHSRGLRIFFRELAPPLPLAVPK